MVPGATRWLLLAALGAVLVAAAGAAARSRTPTAVGVGAREFRFAVYRASVPPGTIRFNLTNRGEDGHDLVVLGRGGRQLARTGEVRPGAQATLSVRLAPGAYRLRCDVADHARRGMRATIRVVR